MLDEEKALISKLDEYWFCDTAVLEENVRTTARSGTGDSQIISQMLRGILSAMEMEIDYSRTFQRDETSTAIFVKGEVVPFAYCMPDRVFVEVNNDLYEGNLSIRWADTSLGEGLVYGNLLFHNSESALSIDGKYTCEGTNDVHIDYYNSDSISMAEQINPGHAPYSIPDFILPDAKFEGEDFVEVFKDAVNMANKKNKHM